ncbi:protein NPG1-like [Phalaenopsis equestris]|uniref:protein NPG1-like n=1 Tax=Phalaenopsis equestris TaxID=78828 RepID=UPI0009E626FC|nr:protein NPG1-like [Phalaenopsis equestris]
MGEEASVNEASLKVSEGEVKPDDGEIQEAELSLREGLSLNYEEARALLGRLEYHKGNIEAALRVFDGIDLQAAIHRLQSSLADKLSPRKSRYRSELQRSASQHAARLVLEAIYLKARSLQKLGRASEAAQECKSVLDAVEKMFRHGIPDVLVENKLQETVRKAVELLPELWKQAGQYQEALISYRRALLGHWNLEDECCVGIQKRFVILLLYGGVEAGPPSLASQTDGSFVPKNNLEEAILILMILLKKWYLGLIQWDPSLMDHFTFALSICGQTNFLSRHIEEVLPGMYPRRDRWYTLALCLCGAGQDKEALNLLRKVLNKHENPGDWRALLLAAKICSNDCLLASEGIYYSQNVIANGGRVENHLKRVGLQFLGICLGKKAKAALSAQERCCLQAEAISSLEAAVVLDHHNSELIYDLGLQYAEQCNTNAAIRCAKAFIDETGGAMLKGWRLLALLLSAQQRYLEAEVVTDAALDETSKWEQGPLLRIKAKVKLAESLPMDAVDTYCFLLALVQAQRKSFGSFRSSTQIEGVKEFEVWQDLAYLYSSLSQWKDVEACLANAMALKPYAASTWHSKGSMHEARSETQAALSSYSNALFMDPDHVPSKVSLGALLWRSGSKPLAMARSFLSDALRLEPMNRMAWYYLGMVHKEDGRSTDAADCFLAASMLEGSEPVEYF